MKRFYFICGSDGSTTQSCISAAHAVNERVAATVEQPAETASVATMRPAIRSR